MISNVDWIDLCRKILNKYDMLHESRNDFEKKIEALLRSWSVTVDVAEGPVDRGGSSIWEGAFAGAQPTHGIWKLIIEFTKTRLSIYLSSENGHACKITLVNANNYEIFISRAHNGYRNDAPAIMANIIQLVNGQKITPKFTIILNPPQAFGELWKVTHLDGINFNHYFPFACAYIDACLHWLGKKKLI